MSPRAHGSDGDPSGVPKEIALRIRGCVDNHQVLELLLEQVSEDDYRSGLRSRDPDRLTRQVYPLERAFEIASNYTRELAALGLQQIDIQSVDGPSDYRRLRDEGVISRALCDALIQIHGARNALQHDYPDLRGSTIYQAAALQRTELPRFLRAYARWMRELGYGRPDS